MLLWRRNFLHTAIMRLMVPNTPHRDRHPASPAGWAVRFFSYHPQVWVGVGVDLLICVCTSESQLTCRPPRSLPQQKKSNQKREHKQPPLFQRRPTEMGEQVQMWRKGQWIHTETSPSLRTPTEELAWLDSHLESFFRQYSARIAQRDAPESVSNPLHPQTGRSRELKIWY